MKLRRPGLLLLALSLAQGAASAETAAANDTSR